MKNLFQSIEAIQVRLESHDIRSAAIGGVAVAIWGEPRVTKDVDLKVLLGRDEAERLLRAMGEDLRPVQPDPLDSLRQVGILFALDASGTRADFLLSDTPHDVEAIKRARRIDTLPGVRVRVCTPEDLVIYKLVATRARDHEDASTVIRRQAGSLDAAYILRWLGEFERALDDSTLIRTFESMRERWRSRS